MRRKVHARAMTGSPACAQSHLSHVIHPTDSQVNNNNNNNNAGNNSNRAGSRRPAEEVCNRLYVCRTSLPYVLVQPPKDHCHASDMLHVVMMRIMKNERHNKSLISSTQSVLLDNCFSLKSLHHTMPFLTMMTAP
eukprot:1155797-Pelagomonas_calceolata.AAC.4